MKAFPLILVSLVMSLSTASFAEAPHGGGPRGPVPHPHKSVFPAYPKRAAPMRGQAPTRRMATPVSEDHLGNRVSADHLNRVEFAHQRSETVMRNSPQIKNHVAFHSAAFAGTLHPIYLHKQTVYEENFNRFHTVVVQHPVAWRDWHYHHFYGGFYYGFHPIPDVSIYFYNPMVHWFYIGTWDDTYYRTWYAQEYEAYPQLNQPFTFYGVYYPTDNLRQLLFCVSAMPVDKQARFRTGITEFTQKLTQQLANFTHQHVALSNGDIVVSHYETLGLGGGLDLEGVVNFQSKSYNFKGLINLETDHQVDVFIAGNGESAPSADQLKHLDELNHQMDEIRGVSSETQAPATAGSTPAYPAEAAPASGEASADPSP
jgi:hypothetical protein